MTTITHDDETALSFFDRMDNLFSGESKEPEKMDEAKTVQSIRVTDPGSMPDVDTDFNTERRQEVYDYTVRKYGEDSVTQIITFGTFGAKSGFKKMCTIFEKNFQQSNRMSKLIPEPIEGEPIALKDLFDPKWDRYEDAAEFRSEVNDDSWKELIDGAIAVDSKISETGVHAAGILISGQPLSGILPTQVRQSDGQVISQWEYPHCEAIGLIKMDFLGLDTIDLIEKAVDYIERNGKKVPDMDAIAQGPMDDPKTLKMVREGKTIGCFQIGKNPGVRDLLRKIQVDSVEDMVATTALYRPGPMEMNSHIRYAERKNGIEEAESIHSDFDGSVMDEILASTYNLIVYQEQLLQISNQIGGLTLQEGDTLRKAMGKKKLDVMESMKPKFFEGGQKNGFSKEALEALWDTMVPFAKYAFNRAHSASYATMAYKTAYLKANYPIEFMAAIIAQKISSGKRNEAKILIKEASTMGIKLGPMDVNSSGEEVAPAVGNSEYDIVFGFAGAKSVSLENARRIAQERKANGWFKSAEDFIRRSLKNNVNNKSVFEAIAYAGGFDSLGHSRKAVVDNIPNLLVLEKKASKKGANLFQMMEMDDEESGVGIVLDNSDEYSFTEKLKKEADMCGIYISAHPLDHAGPGLNASGRVRIKSLFDDSGPTIPSYKKKSIRLIGSLTDIETKNARNGGKRYTLTVDDGSGYVDAFVVPHLSQGFMKHSIIKAASAKRDAEDLSENYPVGEWIPKEFMKLYKDDMIDSVPEPQLNEVYILECTAIKRDGDVKVVVEDIIPFNLDHEGHLPVRLRIKDEWLSNKKKLQAALKTVAKKHPGDTEFWIASANNYSISELTSGIELPLKYKNTGLKVETSRQFMRDMEKIFTSDLFDLGVVSPVADIER